MQCNERTAINNHLDSCPPFPQDVCMKTWPSLEEEWQVSILRFPKHFLLDGCMYLSYQILKLGYLLSLVENRFGATFFLNFNSNIEIYKVAPHILSTHISPCPTSFRPLPLGLKSLFLNSSQYWPVRQYDNHLWACSMPNCAQVHRLEGDDRTVESVRAEVSRWSGLFARRPIVGWWIWAKGWCFWVEEWDGMDG